MGDDNAFPGAAKVMNQLARLFVIHQRAHRHLQNRVDPLASGAIRAFSVPSPVSLVLRVVAEVDQRVVRE